MARKKHFIPQERVERVLSAFRSGVSMMDIGNSFGMGANTIRRLISEAGLSRPNRRLGRTKFPEAIVGEPEPEPAPSPPAMTSAQEFEIRRLHAKRLPLTQIAALVRVPYRDVVAAIEGPIPATKPCKCTLKPAWRS